MKKEAEEAAWWRENSDLLSKHLRAAVKFGESINPEELRRRIEDSKKKRATMVALRIPQADLAMARKQAKQMGLLKNRREERVPKGKKP